MITLIYPYPADQLRAAWEWMNEFPLANLDDYGPKSYEEFEQDMLARLKTEVISGVKHRDKLVGIIGYLPITSRYGMFHGICFSKAVHGQGVASQAVRKFVANLFANGVEKISASYFADNRRVRRLLGNIGAVDEGYMRRQTTQKGKPVDSILVAIFKEQPCL